MDWLLTIIDDPARLQALAGRLPELAGRGALGALEWARTPENAWSIGAAFALPALVCLRFRRWLLTVAVVASGAAAYAALFPEAALCRTLGICIPAAPMLAAACFALLAGLLTGADAYRSSRALGRRLAEIDSRDVAIATLEERLVHERFWRSAAGDGRSILPTDEILELARKVQEPLLARTGAKTGNGPRALVSPAQGAPAQTGGAPSAGTLSGGK